MDISILSFSIPYSHTHICVNYLMKLSGEIVSKCYYYTIHSIYKATTYSVIPYINKRVNTMLM